MPVLYGVFLYMGVASLSGIQVEYVHTSTFYPTGTVKCCSAHNLGYN